MEAYLLNHFYLKNLGSAIKTLREELNIKQSELAQGICHQSQISKIENGSISPYVHTLALISRRLGVSPLYFLNQLLKKEYSFVFFVRNEIRNATIEKDYNKVRSLLNKHKNSQFLGDLEEKQFLIWHYGIVTFYLDKNYSNALILLHESLDLKKVIQHSNQDFHILNSIGVIYSEIQDWENAIKTFHRAIKVSSNYKEIEVTTLSKIYYNLSKAYLGNQDYYNALLYCSRGITNNIEGNSTFLLGELFYQRAYLVMEYCKFKKIDNAKNWSWNSFSVLDDFTTAHCLFSVLEKKAFKLKAKEKIDYIKRELI